MNKIMTQKNSYRIFFTDYGNVDIVDNINIRSMWSMVDENVFPALACRFYIDGISPKGNVWKADELHLIEKLTVYRKLIVTVKKVIENQKFLIHSQEIISHLQRYLKKLNC
jgi:hypothetical protein